MANSRPSSPSARALADRLRPVLLRLSRELRREAQSLGVTGGQVSLLIQIKKHPGITASELAEHERMSAPGMSGPHRPPRDRWADRAHPPQPTDDASG